MTLGQLLDLHVSGALKIKYEDGDNTAVLGGSTRITLEQAQQLCYKFGWTEFYLNAFEIIAKTNSMMSSLKRVQWGQTGNLNFGTILTLSSRIREQLLMVRHLIELYYTLKVINIQFFMAWNIQEQHMSFM